MFTFGIVCVSGASSIRLLKSRIWPGLPFSFCVSRFSTSRLFFEKRSLLRMRGDMNGRLRCEDGRMRRNILRHNRARLNFHMISDGNITDQHRAGTDQTAIPDHGRFSLVFTDGDILINPAFFPDFRIAGNIYAVQTVRKSWPRGKPGVLANIAAMLSRASIQKNRIKIPFPPALRSLPPKENLPVRFHQIPFGPCQYICADCHKTIPLSMENIRCPFCCSEAMFCFIPFNRKYGIQSQQTCGAIRY